ncbi:MAG TPA: endonuclease/exonuclease/phosphatase family protein [Pyrinomonadaceae bacterium]|jgi:endonuclease/exonuclease/phosphatase family metal-dependent hydrolase
MRLATFNIYWLGDEDKIVRTEQDRSIIARVIARLNADVIIFEEIVVPEELQKIIDLVNDLTHRSYRLRDNDDRFLCDNSQLDVQGLQKVFAVYDAGQYELLAASPLRGGVGRRPFGLRLRHKTDGGQALVVGVHLKSGQPFFTDEGSSDKRKKQCQHLADWVAGKHASSNDILPGPSAGEHVVITGDFNALYESNNPEYAGVVASLDPLREGVMADWWWDEPLRDPAGGDRTTSYLEHLLIDYVMLSPSLKGRVVQQPTIYAYDLDPNIGASGIRISDHRPVVCELKL